MSRFGKQRIYNTLVGFAVGERYSGSVVEPVTTLPYTENALVVTESAVAAFTHQKGILSGRKVSRASQRHLAALPQSQDKDLLLLTYAVFLGADIRLERHSGEKVVNVLAKSLAVDAEAKYCAQLLADVTRKMVMGIISPQEVLRYLLKECSGGGSLPTEMSIALLSYDVSSYESSYLDFLAKNTWVETVPIMSQTSLIAGIVSHLSTSHEVFTAVSQQHPQLVALAGALYGAGKHEGVWEVDSSRYDGLSATLNLLHERVVGIGWYPS